MRPAETALTVTLFALASSACIVKDTTHRLYLSPAGGVTWTVLEQDVRSDARDLMTRWREEQDFLVAIAGDVHPAAEDLRRLGAEETSTRVLRRERPYLVYTVARVARVDRLAERILAELELSGSASLESDRGRTTLTVTIDVSAMDEEKLEKEWPQEALIEELERYRIVLTDGRFVSASGFEIVEDGTVAVPRVSDRPSEGGSLKLQLTWTAGR